MRTLPALLSALLALTATASPTPGGTPAPTDLPQAAAPEVSFSFAQLGAEADKQGAQAASALTPTATGARLKALMQDLEAEATPEGLWLTSTADEDAGKPNRFRVKAAAVARASSFVLPPSGPVRVSADSALWLRPGLVEEYRVSTDGVRQDFVVMERLDGSGDLAVELEVTGARAEAAAYGAKLTVTATGRELAYSRLHVTDATGRELTARLDVVDAGCLRVSVQDVGAAYPVRIDPTFSDADWISLGGLTGANNIVRAIAVDDSGNLYVGGDFTAIGTVFANRIAKWNGSAWSALGSDMNGWVYALAVSGGELYAGGNFSTAGGTSVNYLAKWDGSVWSALGTGMDSVVRALAVSGGELYAGGDFSTAGGTSANRIAKWDGSAWSALGTGMNNNVHALAVSGGELYAGGAFTTAGVTSANYLAKWNGSVWSALGSGIGGVSFPVVYALAVSGGDLYAGGNFTTAGGTTVNHIAKWNGSAWSALGSGMNSYVTALAVSGSELYAGGDFTTAGGTSALRIAKWNGTNSTWSALGTGMNRPVRALAMSGSDLYAGGDFTTAGGVANTSRIAKWNGSAWSALGTGMSGGTFFSAPSVYALAVSGGELYAGGGFTTAGGTSALRIAKWDGSAWSALGTGMNSDVYALAVSGRELYAGGDFTTAGGKVSGYAARASLSGSVPATIAQSGNDFLLSFPGEPGLSYRVQYTTGPGVPQVWNEFAPPAIYTAAPNGAVTHRDVNPPDPQRLYRAVPGP